LATKAYLLRTALLRPFGAAVAASPGFVHPQSGRVF